MDVEAYLARIGYQGSRTPNRHALEALCIAHLRSVPFENFDIHLGVPLRLDLPSLNDKIIRRRRGGFCYELNGLFAELLRTLGFRVELLSARVIRRNSTGPALDHMALHVWDSEGQEFLVDVGFGDAASLPMPLYAGATRVMAGVHYRLLEHPEGLALQVEAADGYLKGYLLNLQPRAMSEFRPMCEHHQTSARSWFTQARICVLLTRAGRISLIEDVFQSSEARTRRYLSPGERLELLRQHFGVDLPRMPENKSKSLGLRLQRQGLRWQMRGQRLRQLVHGRLQQ